MKPVEARGIAKETKRKGLMRNYADFSVCTSDALDFACRRLRASNVALYDFIAERITESVRFNGFGKSALSKN